MSGFFGIFRADGRDISPVLLPRIAAVLRFRGPHGELIRTQPGVGTCFAYFATGPAKQALQQPVSLNGNWLLGDVRVDARHELIDQLAASGTSVPEDATSEALILRSWQTWGEAALAHLTGDFSFALWDGGNRCLSCARDFVGPRPFYYAHGGGIFCFSNTLETLRLVPEISLDLDEMFVGEFLLRGYCSDLSRTIYAQIHRLPAGHLLSYKDDTIKVRRFLTLPIEEPHRFSRPEEYLEVYRQVLREAVKDRLPQGPAALYLSGGLDSASVCAVSSQIAPQCDNRELLKAFTVGWRPLFADPEPNYASLTARHLGLSHHVLEDQNYSPFAPRPDTEPASPEPDIEAFSSRAWQIYRSIAKHSPVILSGDGGDDVLTGQSWPYFAYLWGAGEWPEMLRTIGSFAWSHGRLPPLRAGIRARLRGLLPGTRQWQGYPNWLNPEFETRAGLRAKWQAPNSVTESEHPIHPQAYASLHKGFWSSVLESEDAGTTQVALETRAPLLDLRILRFLLRVPPVPWCVDKELTRRAMHGYLPDAILQRPKTPMLEDPLEVCLASGRWSPRIPDDPPSAIHQFVDWHRWIATLGSPKGLTVGSNLFPLVLVSWLKVVENAHRIE
jgi:asparagine synthase (glutamine-hydrolysing)